jgi:hypothetical protein
MDKFQFCKNLNSTLIGVDANAKNKLWGSNRTYKKGMELENYMIQNNLSVDNIPNCKLEHAPLRTVKVDVTLSGDNIKVLEWKFLYIISLQTILT